MYKTVALSDKDLIVDVKSGDSIIFTTENNGYKREYIKTLTEKDFEKVDIDVDQVGTHMPTKTCIHY